MASGITTTQSPPWQAIAEKKRQERASKIPKEWLLATAISEDINSHSPQSIMAKCELLSKTERNLTNPDTHDATSLLQKLASSELSSTELVTAFCKRAAIAHQLTNCLTEILFDDAIARAKQLDEHLKATGKPVGPLHGLPITFKDCFDIRGTDASIGLTPLCFDPSKRNSQLYDILTNSGAIVIAKTTVPQTMLNSDTDSIAFGRTVNPYNRSFGAAGSSGGEGALLSLGGSPFGIGTDGAGSVRMPAAVNGIIGYKPSGYRLPLDGRRVMGTGVVGTTILGPVSVTGFLGRSMRDISLFTRITAQAQPWETSPFLYPHPWQNISLPSPQKLRIGIWSSNDYLHLHPPVERGLNTAVSRLRAAGVQLIPFQGPDISDAWTLQKEWTEIQDLSYLRDLLAKEPHTEIVKATGIIDKHPPPPELTISYLHSLNRRISTLVARMHRAWNDNVDGKPIDALLWVPAPHTAVPFDKYTYLGFTGLFNVIDWPAMALPMGMFVDREVDEKVEVEAFNELDGEIQGMYDPNAFHGLPLSVQLIGRRFEDEKLLAVSEVVHEIIRQS